MKLSQKNCQSCSGNVAALDEEEIKNLLLQLQNWQTTSDKKWIFKEFKFKDFAKTLDFVNVIGRVAENEGHLLILNLLVDIVKF